MDATAILGLMSDLYAQISRLTAENAALSQEVVHLRATGFSEGSEGSQAKVQHD